VASFPDVPTIAEAGVTGYRFDSGWHAWFAPAKTPASVVAKIYNAVREALKEPKLREYLIAGGYEPRGDPPEEFRKIFASDVKMYAEIVRAAKIEAQ
jgi:tripartite-type tricarboxylate transporter receptor subunit TctC